MQDQKSFSANNIAKEWLFREPDAPGALDKLACP